MSDGHYSPKLTGDDNATQWQKYQAERARYETFSSADVEGRQGRQEEIRTSPLLSLAVKYAVDHKVYRDNSTDGDDHIAGSCPSSQDSSQKSPSSNATPKTDDLNEHTGNSDRMKRAVFPQYALLGHYTGEEDQIPKDEPILLNVNAPSSAFICGSQGSGKSYTLACMLENVLRHTKELGHVDKPVAGVVFHYDVDSTDSIAEAAHLASRGIKVNVLVSKRKQHDLTRAYQRIESSANITIKPLLLRSSDLSIDRMHKLMATAEKEGPLPLYMEIVLRILREIPYNQTFNYERFKKKVFEEHLTKDQTGPLNQRFSLLESFMVKKNTPMEKQKLFDLTPGTLTIIDLSDSFIDSAQVCILFDICLSVIKEQRPESGLCITLDEAHKYMNKSAAADAFTERLLTTIREQRHNASRVIIATQEPTISEKLLDLCSMTIVHRFTSPAWYSTIREHLSGASTMVTTADGQNEMFRRIVHLNVGESLVFAPSAFMKVDTEHEKVNELGPVAMKMKTRRREGTDGGMSILAAKTTELVMAYDEQNDARV